MKHLVKGVALIGVAVFVGGSLPSSAWGVPQPLQGVVATEETPRSVISSTLDALIVVVGKFPGDENRAERRAGLREIIQPRFDFDEMAKRSLGTHWGKITPVEQGEFVSIFSDLLAKTYLKRIENIKPDIVSIKGEKVTPDGAKATVATIVIDKGDEFPISYKMYLRDGSWRVYDVIIENIGLVTNYRNEFAGIMRKEKFVGLMARLRDKASSSE